jgi:hypothetical protein
VIGNTELLLKSGHVYPNNISYDARQKYITISGIQVSKCFEAMNDSVECYLSEGNIFEKNVICTVSEITDATHIFENCTLFESGFVSSINCTDVVHISIFFYGPRFMIRLERSVSNCDRMLAMHLLFVTYFGGLNYAIVYCSDTIIKLSRSSINWLL